MNLTQLTQEQRQFLMNRLEVGKSASKIIALREDASNQEHIMFLMENGIFDKGDGMLSLTSPRDLLTLGFSREDLSPWQHHLTPPKPANRYTLSKSS